MSNLMQRMKKASVVDNAAVLSKSDLFKNKDFIHLPVPMMNVAFSGKFNGGFANGLIQLAGPSKHFKSNMALVLCKAFLDKHDDGVILFYDSEFGSTEDYFKVAGIDVDRVLHIPIMNIEEFKMDVIKKLEEVDVKTDKVLIYVDSVGNTASKKEMEDAINEKSVTDMTRAKQLKSVFRMVTPYLTQKKIPMIVINHTYQTQETYSKTVVSGGTGIEYSSNTIFTIGKRQVKDGDELVGWEFVLNANKSRYIKEKSAIPITVTYSGGIDKWSGLLDVALATGHVTKPKVGWFTRPNVDGPEGKNWRKAGTNCAEFWDPLLSDKKFCSDVEALFVLTSSQMFVLNDKEEGGVVKGVEALVPGVDFDPGTGELYDQEDETAE